MMSRKRNLRWLTKSNRYVVRRSRFRRPFFCGRGLASYLNDFWYECVSLPVLVYVLRRLRNHLHHPNTPPEALYGSLSNVT